MKYFLLCFISLFLTSCAGGNRKGKAQYQYIKDLQEQKVAVMMGTAAELQIGVQYPGIPVDRFETETDLVQAFRVSLLI